MDGHLEELGGSGLAVAGGLHGFTDVIFFQVVEQCRQVQAAGRDLDTGSCGVMAAVGTVVGQDRSAGRREGDGTLDDVLELADVAVPVALLQDLERFGRHLKRLSRTRRELPDKMLRQTRDVVAAFAKRRNVQRYHRYSIKKVAAECAG